MEFAADIQSKDLNNYDTSDKRDEVTDSVISTPSESLQMKPAFSVPAIHMKSVSSSGEEELQMQPENRNSHFLHPPVLHRTSLPIQRDMLTGEQAFEEINRDRIYEYFAHDIGYLDQLPTEVQQHVQRLGFSAEPVISGSFGLVVRVFTPNEEAMGRGHIPIIVFRGTELDLADIFDDLNREGTGMRQFNVNRRLIRHIMEEAGRADVTGHSLGGALAQIAAALFPGHVRRVVTFQSPGIPVSLLRGLSNDDNLRATHYRAAHDIVDDVGEGHIRGTVYEVNFDAVSDSDSAYENGELFGEVVSAHTSSPIDRLRDIRTRSQTDLTRVQVTRHRTSQPNRNRLIETFRRDVLGIEHPQDYTELSPDQMLDRFDEVREELQGRMSTWISTYHTRINELDQNLIFILLEIVKVIYEDGEQVDMWEWILNSSPGSMREALHRRLIAYINPNDFDTAPGMQSEQYQRIRDYHSSP